MENLQTFEAAAASQGIDPTILPDISLLPECIGKAILAAYKLMVISKAAWNGIEIDWSNYSQRKYFPWFDLESGFSSDDDFCYARSLSGVDSRLCYPSYEVAEYVAKTHIDLYKDLMV